MKFRHKPTEVDAFQYDGDFKTQDGKYYVPKWAVDALEEHHVLQYRDAGDLYIVEEGPVLTKVDVGDFIVNDDGFIYTLQEEPFLNLFEKVEEFPEHFEGERPFLDHLNQKYTGGNN